MAKTTVCKVIIACMAIAAGVLLFNEEYMHLGQALSLCAMSVSTVLIARRNKAKAQEKNRDPNTITE